MCLHRPIGVKYKLTYELGEEEYYSQHMFYGSNIVHTPGVMKTVPAVYSFNQRYLFIPKYTGSWGNPFHETHGKCIE